MERCINCKSNVHLTINAVQHIKTDKNKDLKAMAVGSGEGVGVVEIISSSRILFHKKLHDLIPPPPPPRPVDTKLIRKYYDSTFFLFVGQFGASPPPPPPHPLQ